MAISYLSRPGGIAGPEPSNSAPPVPPVPPGPRVFVMAFGPGVGTLRRTPDDLNSEKNYRRHDRAHANTHRRQTRAIVLWRTGQVSRVRHSSALAPYLIKTGIRSNFLGDGKHHAQTVSRPRSGLFMPGSPENVRESGSCRFLFSPPELEGRTGPDVRPQGNTRSSRPPSLDKAYVDRYLSAIRKPWLRRRTQLIGHRTSGPTIVDGTCWAGPAVRPSRHGVKPLGTRGLERADEPRWPGAVRARAETNRGFPVPPMAAVPKSQFPRGHRWQ